MSEHPLALKLSGFIDLTAAERRQIDAWSTSTTTVPARKTLVRQRAQTGSTCLMLSGWAYRYKDMRSGTRQIVGLLLPGDMCHLHGFVIPTTDHGIRVLSDATMAIVPKTDLVAGLQAHPRLIEALWWSTLVDECITREWLVNIGQRDAATRIAHLFCEIWARADRIGLIKDQTLTLPLTQTELGEALGQTSVHTNRVLRVLREQGLAALQRGKLVIPNLDQLKAFAGFDPTYLQLTRVTN